MGAPTSSWRRRRLLGARRLNCVSLVGCGVRWARKEHQRLAWSWPMALCLTQPCQSEARWVAPRTAGNLQKIPLHTAPAMFLHSMAALPAKTGRRKRPGQHSKLHHEACQLPADFPLTPQAITRLAAKVSALKSLHAKSNAVLAIMARQGPLANRIPASSFCPVARCRRKRMS